MIAQEGIVPREWHNEVPVVKRETKEEGNKLKGFNSNLVKVFLIQVHNLFAFDFPSF